MHRERMKWAQMSRVLGQEGADVWTLGMFYITVVKTVLIYRSESWAMSRVLVRHWEDYTIS